MNNFLIGIINRKSAIQIFRYGLVGFAVNLLGYMVYLLITYLGGTPKSTMSILYGLGATISFWGNRKLTFAHQGSVLASGTRYLIAHCFGYVINLVILIVMVDKLGYAHQWVQAIAILIVALFLFFALKLFVFGKADFSNGGE